MSYNEYFSEETVEEETAASYDPNKIDEYIDERDPEQLHLADLNIVTRTRQLDGSAKETKLTAQCYRAAIGRDDVIYLLDVAGPAMTIRAISAGLNKSVSTSFQIEGAEDIRRYTALKKDEQHGYRTETTTIGPPGCSLTHFIAISNAPGFMPYVNATALAKSLGTDHFSTPFLTPVLHGPGVPDWMPYICKRLIEESTLQYTRSHNCKGGILKSEGEMIEKIVSEGVRDGHLPWVPYDIDEILKAINEQPVKV
jgi:hypothetical protein